MDHILPVYVSFFPNNNDLLGLYCFPPHEDPYTGTPQ